MGYLFHCPECKYDLCKKCDFNWHGKVLEHKLCNLFQRNKGFYEVSISEFLSADEIITTLNLDELNETVWLGTNIGNLISFKSLTLEKKD